MDQLLEQQLLAIHVNIPEGVARFAGNQALYEKFLYKFLDDPTFAQLEQAVASQDWDVALTAAHTLKGVTGNLAIGGLYDASTQMVSHLRQSDQAAALAAYADIRQAYGQLIDILRG